MDYVSVRYRTIPVVSVLTCILQCTVLNCFKLRRLIENKVFYPQGGCGGRKNFSFRHCRHLGDSPSPAREGGVEKSCLIYEFPGWFCRLFIFLGVRGASSNSIKTRSQLLARIRLNPGTLDSPQVYSSYTGRAVQVKATLGILTL